ncbi:MAG: hypothetical protein QW469_01505 [Candidatus Aenigmatarchaeota archaeon]
MNSKKEVIPEEEIKKAIVSVLKKKKIDSQEMLYSEVKKIIRNLNIKPERLRLLASEIPEVLVIVETKSGGLKVPEKCPACHTKLKKIEAKNLLNKKVVVGLKCEKCKYYGSIKEFSPYRYKFEIKEK